MRLLKLFKSNNGMFALYLCYRILLDVIYIFWANPTFNYMGLTKQIDFSKLILSYILTFLFIALIPKGNSKVSKMILQLHFIIMIIPFLSIYGIAGLSTNFTIMVAFCFLIQIIGIQFLPDIKLVKIKNGKIILRIIILFMTVVTYTYLFRTQPINLNAFNFNEIYSIRGEQSIDSTLMKYFLVWQYRVINPMMIVVALINKKSFSVVLVVFMQTAIYLMYPHKEVVLSIGLLFLGVIIFKKRINFDKSMTVVLMIISTIGTLLYSFFDYLILFGIIPVRMLNMPAKIKFEHFDFFSKYEKLYYSEGMIGKLLNIEYPYSISSGMLVNPRGGNSNTGYIAYAYDNMGFIGMVLMTILFIGVLKFIDSLAIKENKGLVFTLFIYPMVVLNDGDLLTMLLTGGLWLLFLILLLYKNIDSGGERLCEKKSAV